MAQRVSIGTAYGEAAAFVAREKKLLAPLVLALMVLPVTVSELIQPNGAFSDSKGAQPWMAVALIALLIGVTGQMAVSRMAMGGDRSLGATIALALQRLPAVIGAFILFFLMLSVVLVPLIIMLTVAGGGTPNAQSVASANAATVVLLLAMVPRILLAPAIAMRERLGPWALLKATWRATRGHYWRLAGFFGLFVVASLVFALAVAAVVGSLATLALGKSDPMTVSRLVVALTGGFAQAIITTLYAAMIGRIVAQLPAQSSSAT